MSAYSSQEVTGPTTCSQKYWNVGAVKVYTASNSQALAPNRKKNTEPRVQLGHLSADLTINYHSYLLTTAMMAHIGFFPCFHIWVQIKPFFIACFSNMGFILFYCIAYSVFTTWQSKLPSGVPPHLYCKNASRKSVFYWNR